MRAALSARGLRAVPVALLALLVTACGGVQVQPRPGLPRALLQPLPARVGLVLNEELRRYVHEETRGGSNWKVDLGPGHEEFFRTIMEASFANVQVFQDTGAARSAGNLQAIFSPEIEQFSFATARETGGQYWAVTIRYRIGILGQDGGIVDNLTLTGYGSTRGGRSANALTRATRSAMRDAAAKFLVQLPRQPVAQKLVAGQALTAADARPVEVDEIETVPIEPLDSTAP